MNRLGSASRECDLRHIPFYLLLLCPSHCHLLPSWSMEEMPGGSAAIWQPRGNKHTIKGSYSKDDTTERWKEPDYLMV